MIAKRADILPFWDISRAKLNQYGSNSVVYYQDSPDSAGYAYRANANYQEIFLPPDINSENWTIDKTFAVPWKAEGKYEIGSRVYYFNGARAYVYTPSVRYFGGNQPPNEELDDDGIRTWELETDYSYSQFSSKVVSEFLFPVKKFFGYTGSKVGSFDPMDPEERPTSYSDEINGNLIEGRQAIVGYLSEKKIISDDWSELNSVYQANPYDTNVYVFQRYNPQNDTFTHLRKGIHRAIYLKQQSVDYPSTFDSKYYTHAKSQYVHTISGYGHYYQKPSGFCIEMWPNVSESDYELVPSSGLAAITLAVRNPLPNYGVSVIPDPFGGGPFDAITFSGETPSSPDGLFGSEATPPELLKYDAGFSRSTPAFNYRICKFAILREDYIHKGYEKVPYTVQENGVEVTKYYYIPKPNGGPTYTMEYETIDSMEESYVEDDGSFKETQSITRSKNKGNPIDFSSYISNGTYTTLIWAGGEID